MATKSAGWPEVNVTYTSCTPVVPAMFAGTDRHDDQPPVFAIAKLPITNHGSLVFAEQNLEALRESGRNDPELEEALEQCIHRGHRREARRERLSNLVAPLTRR